MEKKNKYEDEISFKAVATTPIRWFGLVYPFFIVVIIAVGLFWIDSLNIITENKTEPMIYPEWKRDVKMKTASILEGVDVAEVSKPTEELLAKGKELYSANCASCHGDGGLGDGAAGETLNPPPRNFTDSEGWKNGRKISEMYVTLEEGIAGTGMAAYEYLPVKDRFAIIHYTRAFIEDPPQDTEEELATLDVTYSLSQGRKTANQIPIEKAVKVFVEDKKQDLEKIDFAMEFVENHKFGPGYEVLEKIVCDMNTGLTTIANASGWRADPFKFAEIITVSAPGNGFNPRSAALTNEEWSSLHQYMKNAFLNNDINGDI